MINIIPTNDLEEHMHITTCHCKPKLKMTNNEMIIIHNSYDKRELVEEAMKEIGLLEQFAFNAGWDCIIE